MPQSEIARRADAIKHEIETRTSRLATDLQGEFAQDDATSVTDQQFHEIIRRNWSDPNWRISTAQRMGPVPLYRAAMEAFGRSLDGTPSVDSHPDAIAAEPQPTEPQIPGMRPDTTQKPSPALPSIFPFQGPAQAAPQPVPVMPVAPPPVAPPQPMMPPIGPQ